MQLDHRTVTYRLKDQSDFMLPRSGWVIGMQDTGTAFIGCLQATVQQDSGPVHNNTYFSAA